jgi:hypothetical protein
MGMCRKILGFLYVAAQPGHGWACLSKCQSGQFIQSICFPKKLVSVLKASLAGGGLGLSGEVSPCVQNLIGRGLPACFRQVPAQTLDLHSELRTPISVPACDPALAATSPASPSDDHPDPHIFSGTLIPTLTSLVERFTAQCPICDAAASHLCHLCGEPFCNAHLYPCSDCTLSLCGECTDVHDAEGHWGDSDTAREMFDSITGGAR